MTIYYITFFLTTLFASLDEKYNTASKLDSSKDDYKTKNLFVALIIIVFTFFAGFRYYVGTDWDAYYYVLHQGFYNSLLIQGFFEPGWNVIGYITTLIFNKFGVAALVAAFITIFLYIKTISKYSCYFAFSVILYFFLTWHGCFNGVRQYLAAAVLFAGHRFIYDKKIWKWVLVVLLATMFHTTAVVMVFWYFIANRRLNIGQVLLLLLITVILYFSYDEIFDFINWYKGDEVSQETGYAANEVSIFRIAVKWAPAVFYFLFVAKKQREKYNPEINFYANMIFLDASLMTASMNSAYLARVGIYTGCFVLIGLPLFIKQFEERDKKIAFILLFICYALYWFYDISVHPDLNNFRLTFGMFK